MINTRGWSGFGIFKVGGANSLRLHAISLVKFSLYGIKLRLPPMYDGLYTNNTL